MFFALEFGLAAFGTALFLAIAPAFLIALVVPQAYLFAASGVIPFGVAIVLWMLVVAVASPFQDPLEDWLHVVAALIIAAATAWGFWYISGCAACFVNDSSGTYLQALGITAVDGDATRSVYWETITNPHRLALGLPIGVLAGLTLGWLAVRKS